MDNSFLIDNSLRGAQNKVKSKSAAKGKSSNTAQNTAHVHRWPHAKHKESYCRRWRQTQEKSA
jgi:hypothetical protein